MRAQGDLLERIYDFSPLCSSFIFPGQEIEHERMKGRGCKRRSGVAVTIVTLMLSYQPLENALQRFCHT